MRGPYGFDLNESCQDFKAGNDGFFRQMSQKAVKDFDAVKSTSAYPEGTVLFLETQDPRGIFVLAAGEVKLSISSREGKTLILHIAKPGEILGLMAVLSGKPYEVTAETVRPCQIAFVRRDDFRRFLAEHPEVLPALTRQLTSTYQAACTQLRTIGLSATAEERLARLLLEWCEGAEQTKVGTRVKVPLTHEEIAECIGSTRETVTRTLSQFKHRNLITAMGSTLVIANRVALENIAA